MTKPNCKDHQLLQLQTAGATLFSSLWEGGGGVPFSSSSEWRDSQVLVGSGSSPGQNPGSTMLHTFHSLQQRRLENWINTSAGGFSEEPAKAWASSVLEGGGRVVVVVVGNPSGRRLFNSFNSTRTLRRAQTRVRTQREKRSWQKLQSLFFLMKLLRSFSLRRKTALSEMDGRFIGTEFLCKTLLLLLFTVAMALPP